MDTSTITAPGLVLRAFNCSAIRASKTVSKFRLSRLNPSSSERYSIENHLSGTINQLAHVSRDFNSGTEVSLN
jgi:hypothetical protein